MWPWKKKKNEDPFPTPEPKITVPPCPHTWKDFPWILRSTYNACQNDIHIVITEPYVCVHCGQRKDVILYEAHKYAYSREFADSLHKEFLKRYKNHIAEPAIVEDMINDAILVDREKLKIVEKLRGERNNEQDNSEDEETNTIRLAPYNMYGDPRTVIH